MTTYYIKKDNKILFIDEDKQKLINTLAFQPDLKKKDIKETDKEIVYFNGEFVFKEEVESEFITDLRNKKIEQLDINCKTFILNKYPETTQLNIIAQNEYTEEDLKTYKEFVAKYRAEYHSKKEQLEQATTEEEIEAVDIEFKEETKKTTKKNHNN